VAVVLLITTTEVREGTTKAPDCTGKVLDEKPCPETMNEVKASAFDILVLKGKKVVEPKILKPVSDSGLRTRPNLSREVVRV
jgi:hypothetical protein